MMLPSDLALIQVHACTHTYTCIHTHDHHTALPSGVHIHAYTHIFITLPSDLALIQDKNFRPIVKKYAKDNALFVKDVCG